MRHISPVLVLALTLPTASLAEETTSDWKIYNFLKEKVANKKIGTKSSAELDNGKVSYDFENQNTRVNFNKTERGFVFNVIWSVKQTNYSLDENGARIDPVVKDRSGTNSCEFVSSRSDGHEDLVHGYCRSIANTISDPTGYATYEQMRIEGDELKIRRQTVGFGDCFAAGDTYSPCLVAHDVTVSLNENGKLIEKQSEEVFNVDPRTLERVSKRGEPKELTFNEL